MKAPKKHRSTKTTKIAERLVEFSRIRVSRHQKMATTETMKRTRIETGVIWLDLRNPSMKKAYLVSFLPGIIPG